MISTSEQELWGLSLLVTYQPDYSMETQTVSNK
jgi:hypothetical protein